MALYESVIIGRQDLTPGQFETLLEKFIAVIQSSKGEIKKRENWGIRNLAYKINKNRKGHYMLLNIDGPPEAIQEYERLMRLDEDIIRFLTIKIKSIDEVKTAEVEITFEPPWTKDLMSEEAKLELGFL